MESNENTIYPGRILLQGRAYERILRYVFIRLQEEILAKDGSLALI
jgi:hypothetical protein